MTSLARILFVIGLGHSNTEPMSGGPHQKDFTASLGVLFGRDVGTAALEPLDYKHLFTVSVHSGQ